MKETYKQTNILEEYILEQLKDKMLNFDDLTIEKSEDGFNVTIKWYDVK